MVRVLLNVLDVKYRVRILDIWALELGFFIYNILRTGLLTWSKAFIVWKSIQNCSDYTNFIRLRANYILFTFTVK